MQIDENGRRIPFANSKNMTYKVSIKTVDDDDDAVRNYGFWWNCCCSQLLQSLLLIGLALGGLILPLILTLTVPPNAKDTPIICLNQTGICSIDSSYKPNLDCIFNDIVNLNGGKSCKTECSYDHQSYKCVCPNEKTWDPPLLNCSMTCRNETSNCSNFASGQHCIPSTDNNNGKDCVTLCSNSVASFECICMPGYVWDKLNLNCVLMCLNKTGNCTIDSYNANLDCIVNDTVSNKEKICKTECMDDLLSYRCDCPNKKIWDPPLLTCSSSCLNETFNCTNFVSGDYCIPSTDTMNGKDCVTSCNNSLASFECICMPGYVWNKQNLICVLSCENATSMACTDIPMSPVSCISSKKSINCSAYCVNGTNLDYSCYCDMNYRWNSNSHECQIICMENDNANCSQIDTDNKLCVTLNQIPNMLYCTSLCDNTGKQSYNCECKFYHGWEPIEKQCIQDCPTDYSECEYFPNKTGQSCFRHISNAYNCRIDCTPSTCAPYICDCRNGLFFDQFYSFSCNLKCEHNPNNDECTVYKSNTACTNLESQLHSVDACIKQCRPTRTFLCQYCRAGGTWDQSTRTCNGGSGNMCRSSMDSSVDGCAICGDKFRPGLNCTNTDGKICKTKCNQQNAIDFDTNSCI